MVKCTIPSPLIRCLQWYVLMMPAAAERKEFSLITPMKTLAEVSSLFRFLAESGFDGSVDSRFGEAVIDRFFGKPAAIK